MGKKYSFDVEKTSVNIAVKLRERAERYSKDVGIALSNLISVALDDYLRNRGY